DAVAAGRELAVFRAVVVVQRVASLDASLHQAVAAGRFLALARARTGVRVRAAFVALFTRLDDAITAARLEAGVAALVVVALVAIVALFARLDLAVTAGRERAGAGACVVVVGVAVVARLARLLDAVAATGGLALGRAGVVVHRVAVVALLRGSRLQRDDAVTAGRLRTQVGTVVLVVA